jgi:alkaline phosphatase
MKLKTLFSLLCMAGASLCATAQSVAEDAPRYIFFFIGDGMGPGQVMGAETYNRLVRKSSDPLLMMQFPVASMCTTYSASTPVTDSAAAGTALATGVKTKNGMLGMSPDTVAVRSVADDLKDAGYGIGLVTNVCPDDATPGAFYAHVPHRAMFHTIGVQAAQSKVDFLAGSMLRGVMDHGKYTGLYEEFARNGVDVIRGVKNLKNATSSRILLLNTDTISQNGGYTIDSIPGINKLTDMTDACIAHLMKYTPDRFFMMVEGGNIDWAGHDNDGATIVKEVLAYDEALERAYQFYLQHPDETLIIVTADHETGGMTVGQKSVGYNCYPRFADYQRMSKARFSKTCREILSSGRDYTWDEMKQMLTEQLGFWRGVPISPEQEAVLIEKFNKTFVTRNDNVNHTLYNDFPEFAEEVYGIMNRTAGFGFTTPNHSGNPVPVFAIGKGAERFGRPLDNTTIPTIIRSLTLPR